MSNSRSAKVFDVFLSCQPLSPASCNTKLWNIMRRPHFTRLLLCTQWLQEGSPWFITQDPIWIDISKTFSQWRTWSQNPPGAAFPWRTSTCHETLLDPSPVIHPKAGPGLYVASSHVANLVVSRSSCFYDISWWLLKQLFSWLKPRWVPSCMLQWQSDHSQEAQTDSLERSSPLQAVLTVQLCKRMVFPVLHKTSVADQHHPPQMIQPGSSFGQWLLYERHWSTSHIYLHQP